MQLQCNGIPHHRSTFCFARFVRPGETVQISITCLHGYSAIRRLVDLEWTWYPSAWAIYAFSALLRSRKHSLTRHSPYLSLAPPALDPPTPRTDTRRDTDTHGLKRNVAAKGLGVGGVLDIWTAGGLGEG